MSRQPTRRPPRADEKIAALLLINWDLQQRLGLMADPILPEHSRKMTASQIASLVEWHHETPHTWTADNHPTNLTPLLIAEHREVTKRQRPAIVKVRRAAKRAASKRKLHSRHRRTMSGDVMLPDTPTLPRELRIAIGELRWLKVSDKTIAFSANLPVEQIRLIRKCKPIQRKAPYQPRSRCALINHATDRVEAAAYRMSIGYLKPDDMGTNHEEPSESRAAA